MSKKKGHSKRAPVVVNHQQHWAYAPRSRGHDSESVSEAVSAAHATNVKDNCCGAFVSKPGFHALVAAVIVVNAILIGVQTDQQDPGETELDGWYVLELVFDAFFAAEIITKIAAMGFSGFVSNSWNVFDATVTVIAVADVLLLTPTFESPLARDLGMVTLLRLLGVIRVARLLRFVRLIDHLYGVVRGLQTTLLPVLWGLFLGFIGVYAFGIFATRLIGHADVWNDGTGELDEAVLDLFGTVPRSMWTLLQVMTLDAWSSEVARTVMEEQPQVWLLFLAWLLVSVFVVFNLITGVVVQKVIEAAEGVKAAKEKHSELRLAQEEAEVLRLFRGLDSANSGRIHRDLALRLLQDPTQSAQQSMAKLLGPTHGTNLAELVRLFDNDGNNLIDYENFTRSVFRMDKCVQRRDLVELNASLCTALGGVRQEVISLQRSVAMALARQSPMGQGAMSPKHASDGAWRAPFATVGSAESLARSGLPPDKVMKGRGNSGLAPLREHLSEGDSGDEGHRKHHKKRSKSKSKSKHRR